MTTFGTARAWLRGHPWVVDAAFAALLLPLVAMIPPARGEASSGLSQALAALACLALVARRRWPLPVWAVTLAIAAVGTAAIGGPTGLGLACAVALYTAASRIDTRRAVLLAAISSMALQAVQLGAGTSGWSDPTSYTLAVWAWLATALGLAVHTQRQIVASAQERARVAEESREEEAQRRVTEERLRIARELHDVVAHHIAVIQVQAGVADHLLDLHPPAARAALAQVRSSSREVIDEMAGLLRLLRSDPDPDGREPAKGLDQLEALAESQRRTGLLVSVRIEGAPVELPPLADVTAYRVVEEALTNARRHGTGSAQVSVSSDARTVTVQVTNPVTSPAVDSGPPPRSTGLGLIGMQERVDAVGGSLTVERADGRFDVRAVLPRTNVRHPAAAAPAAGGTGVAQLPSAASAKPVSR